MRASSIVFLLCGIIILMIDSAGARKSKGPRPGKTKCLSVTSKTSSVRLRCGDNDVIYSLSINTYNGSACDRTSCSGLQPQVLTDSLLCYSRGNCTIDFSNEAPIVKTQDAQCIGKTPSSMQLSFECIRKDIFIALNRKGQTEGRDDVKLDSGMLVSHATYPWHYARNLMLNMTLSPKSTDRRKLFISVPVFDIDIVDEVQMTNYKEDGSYVFKNIRATQTGSSEMFLSSPDVKITLKFNTENASSCGKGFLLCFYWAKDGEDMSKVDICSKVTARRKKGKRGKKGDKRKGKKFKKGKKRKNRKEKRGKGRKRNKKT